MIQRIQSLYLLLSSICLGLMFKFPFATFADKGSFDAYGLNADNSSTVNQIFAFPPYYAIVGLIFVSILVIFLFKKRKLQTLLCRINYVLILGLIVLLYLNVDKMQESFGTEIEYGIGLYLPVAALAFNFLASRAIKKDEDLVKSLDRLR